jgi:two-component system KDP operon response regulator KdpE
MRRVETNKILIIDDEAQITRVLRRGLMAHRYVVRVAPDGETGLELFDDFQPDLVITDLSMPEMNGIEVSRKLRERSAVPIIVLSVKGEEKTKVEALDAGADDYITKPFGMEELLARIRVALRRAPAGKEASRIEAGDFVVDLDTHLATVRGTEVHLTPKEFDLLAFLLKNHSKVLTHRALLAAVWGGNFTEQTEYLRVFVGNLRKKIEPNPAEPVHILTEPWVGYRFIPTA